MSTRKANQTEVSIAADEAQIHSLSTGEVLHAKNLCPLVIVRTYGAGVHVGYLARTEGQEVELLDARRIWSWNGANTLHEVAVDGISGQCRVSVAVRQIRLSSVIETLPVSDKAALSLLESRWEQ